MKENVGSMDRNVRFIAGPSLILFGLTAFGGRSGRPLGLLSMLAGFALTETAITRVCPLNQLFGIDSRSPYEKLQDETAVVDWTRGESEKIQPQEDIAESLV